MSAPDTLGVVLLSLYFLIVIAGVITILTDGGRRVGWHAWSRRRRHPNRKRS